MESGPSSNLQAQVPTARGLTALAYCSCCITFVGLGLAANPLGASENIKITTLGHGPAVSHHLVQVRDREEPHLHKLHDGTVILVKGQGYLMMENRRIDLSTSDIVYIPRGAVHYFVNTASEPTVAFVVFSPPFDGKDTVPVPNP